MQEADNDCMMIDQDGWWVKVSSIRPAHPGSHGQRAVQRLLLLLLLASKSNHQLQKLLNLLGLSPHNFRRGFGPGPRLGTSATDA